MERIIYEPTERQLSNWNFAGNRAPTLPTDEQFKMMAKKSRKPWGLMKRDWIVSNMKSCREYQLGLWQGRVDSATGWGYDKSVDVDANVNSYNLGYYRGYNEYEGRGTGGWDMTQAAWFKAKYQTAPR